MENKTIARKLVGGYDMRNFTIRDMTQCGKALRAMGENFSSFEDAANGIVRHLYDNLMDGQTGRQACCLARFFRTYSYKELSDELQHCACDMLGNAPPFADMKCLVLTATAGEKPEWNSIKASAGHRAIPLPSEETIRQIPMIQNLLKQLGVSVHALVRPDPKILLDMDQKTYNVFYIPDALGSPYIPAQVEFVVPFGVQSVLGFGGALPSGDIYALILFLKVPVSREAAALFRTLSLNVKIAILPFEKKTFSSIA